MGNPPRTCKRVHAIRRAPDGSAFEKCDDCGGMVAIALVDMHECEVHTQKNGMKRFKGFDGKPHPAVIVTKQFSNSVSDQPRSPFRFFMDDFMSACMTGNLVSIDHQGFETWKNMSMEERQPYVIKAQKVNSAYTQGLIQEIGDFFEVDDEADSAEVGKFNPFNEEHRSHYNSHSSYTLWSGGLESLNTWEREIVQTWIADSVL